MQFWLTTAERIVGTSIVARPVNIATRDMYRTLKSRLLEIGKHVRLLLCISADAFRELFADSKNRGGGRGRPRRAPIRTAAPQLHKAKAIKQYCVSRGPAVTRDKC